VASRSSSTPARPLRAHLADIPVAAADVLELARLAGDAGFEETAERLEDSYRREVKVLALSIAERKELLASLAECDNKSLAMLRGILLLEPAWRRENGLV
jgi:hypothetical protein